MAVFSVAGEDVSPRGGSEARESGEGSCRFCLRVGFANG